MRRFEEFLYFHSLTDDRLLSNREPLMTIRLLFTFLGLSAYSHVVNAADLTTLLGALEELPGSYAGQPNFRSVRVLFQKNGRDWQSFPSNCPDSACLKTIPTQYPREIAWTVGFTGKAVGQVTGRTPNEFKFYSDVGLQEITSKGPVPTVGKRSAEYGDFSGYPVFRPLIASSQRSFVDPESWKPSRLSTKITTALRVEFRRRFPNVSNCTKEDDSTEKPWQYRDEEIRINKSSTSSLGWALAQVFLVGNRCEGPAGGAFLDQWFSIDPKGQVAFLGEGMWLVDVGDYDNDGKSEAVFSISRENRGGYRLFYNDFKRHAEFEFNYH